MLNKNEANWIFNTLLSLYLSNLTKGLFIYGAQKFFGYELKNFLAKDEKFFSY